MSIEYWGRVFASTDSSIWYPSIPLSEYIRIKTSPRAVVDEASNDVEREQAIRSMMKVKKQNRNHDDKSNK